MLQSLSVIKQLLTDNGIPFDGNIDKETAWTLYQSAGIGAETEQDEFSKVDESTTNYAKKIFPVVPFPDVLPKYLHGLTMRYSAALQCQFSFMAMVFLTILSGVIGNSITMAIKNSWKTAPFIWLGIVDKSGAGKSHPIKAGMDYIQKLHAVEVTKHEKLLIQYEADLKVYKQSKSTGEPPKEPDPMRHYYSQDFTIESLVGLFKRTARGLVVYVDELAGLLKGLGQYKSGRGSDDEQFLSLYGCGAIKPDRASKNTFCRESGAACIGGIQPSVFSEVFGDKAVANGMLYRWLPVVMNATPPDFSDDDISEIDEANWNSLIDWMYEIPAETCVETGYIQKNVLTCTPDAKELFKAFHNELSHVQPFLPSRFAGYIPKMKDYCLKFMSILHCLECFPENKLSLIVEKSTVEKSILLTRYFLGQQLQLCDEIVVTGNPFHSALRKAIESLRSEVVVGKLLLSRIRERMNELLPPEQMIEDSQAKRLTQWVNDIGLTVVTGTGNKRYILIV